MCDPINQKLLYWMQKGEKSSSYFTNKLCIQQKMKIRKRKQMHTILTNTTPKHFNTWASNNASSWHEAKTQCEDLHVACTENQDLNANQHEKAQWTISPPAAFPAVSQGFSIFSDPLSYCVSNSYQMNIDHVNKHLHVGDN